MAELKTEAELNEEIKTLKLHICCYSDEDVDALVEAIRERAKRDTEFKGQESKGEFMDEVDHVASKQVCMNCKRERSAGDFLNYDPLQVVMGTLVGWYSGSDGELCGSCMKEMFKKVNRI